MDAISFVIAAVGLLLTTLGMPWVGGLLYAGALIAFPIALTRRIGLGTLLPFSFAGHFVVLVVAMLASALLRRDAPEASIAVLGLFIYYYACVSLVERKVRYVPWATGFSWRTAHRAERPGTYWTWVVFFLTLAAVPLTVAFLSAAGLLSVDAG